MCLYQCSWWRGSNQAIMATKASVTKRQPKTQQSWRSVRDGRRPAASAERSTWLVTAAVQTHCRLLSFFSWWLPRSAPVMICSSQMVRRSLCLFVCWCVCLLCCVCVSWWEATDEHEYINTIAYRNPCRPMVIRTLIILHVCMMCKSFCVRIILIFRRYLSLRMSFCIHMNQIS